MTTMICEAWEKCQAERKVRYMTPLSHCLLHKGDVGCDNNCPMLFMSRPGERGPRCREATDEELVYFKLMEGKDR